MSDDDRVLIIGGGLGGIAAANSLQRAGIKVALFERYGAIAEIGAPSAIALASSQGDPKPTCSRAKTMTMPPSADRP